MTLAEKFVNIDNQIRILELKQKEHEEKIGIDNDSVTVYTLMIECLKGIENRLIQTYQKQGSWF